MAVTAAKSVMAFRVLTMAVDLCRLTTRTMNVNAGHERTSKARIIHQIQLIRGITKLLVAENPSPVVYTEKLWRRTIVSFSPDHERINHLMNQRKSELADVESYITTKECKMQFLRRALDEPGAEHCGKCSSCLQHPLLSPDIDSGLLHAANLFIKHADLPLNLNKQVAAGAFTQYGFKGNLPASLQGSTG
ncbi:ATP-dependent DNA helicase, RecQ family domain protein [Shigella dysenteriae 1617]|nr:ATP-dependent DNA helicase, RecQ family domain protein [Shigella dysenteriae 1617]SPZ82167.1 flagellar motor transmembrane channel protein [Shigella dysenteriae]